MSKSYHYLIRLNTFKERYDYLKIGSKIGDKTFGGRRIENQYFYRSGRWRAARDKAIIRDNGCDLAIPGFEIADMIYVHHINPLTPEDIEEDRDCLYDLDNLVCVSFSTHQAIHYGDSALLPPLPKERRPNDTILWRQS